MDFSALEQRVASVGMKMLANVLVSPRAGVVFGATMKLADADVFEVARITTHVLGYLAPTMLAKDDVLTIDVGPYAGSYKVIEPPRRIDAVGYQAELVKQ